MSLMMLQWVSEQKLRLECYLHVKFSKSAQRTFGKVAHCCSERLSLLETLSLPSSGATLEPASGEMSKSHTGVTAFTVGQEPAKSGFVWEWGTPCPQESSPSFLLLQSLNIWVWRHSRAFPGPQCPADSASLLLVPCPLFPRKHGDVIISFLVQRKRVDGF